ncbi:hypothetical protein FLJC2902T_00220 [Flavobacterium limnosediminis JC2902]|uniref:Uncharacterized protein n=1 Tax=Flavobacterium limnosediminis JC2902 TaxID=1341181 RepID=V6STQ1_9FLAO|nr:hypothetical protein FLJC2902T_00220 [Flavobacterium limnosediminis JC2902]
MKAYKIIVFSKKLIKTMFFIKKQQNPLQKKIRPQRDRIFEMYAI